MPFLQLGALDRPLPGLTCARPPSSRSLSAGSARGAELAASPVAAVGGVEFWVRRATEADR